MILLALILGMNLQLDDLVFHGVTPEPVPIPTQFGPSYEMECKATKITLANQPFVYPHIPPLGVFAPPEPHLDPSNALLVMPPVEHRNVTYIIDTNGPCPDVDCNYVDTNGNCVLQKCPVDPDHWLLSWNVDPAEPSISEVYHAIDNVTNYAQCSITTNASGTLQTNLVKGWNILAMVNGSQLTISNLNPHEHFMVRSCIPGYNSPWNSQ